MVVALPECSALLDVSFGDLGTTVTEAPDEVGIFGDIADRGFADGVLFAVVIDDAEILGDAVATASGAVFVEGELAAEQLDDAVADGGWDLVVAAMDSGGGGATLEDAADGAVEHGGVG